VTGSALDDLFGALAEPTRRALFQRLLHEGPQTATVLAADAALTRQAVVKHLQALVSAGLATAQRSGREVRYVATPERLAVVLAWLTESSATWDKRISRLVERAGRVGAEVVTPAAGPSRIAQAKH
jgi:DNA-binding transcriptional ArsR family regulator